NFTTLVIARQLFADANAQYAHDEDLSLKVDSFAFYPGDLIVDGNFDYDDAVFVLGDLKVAGVIRDSVECSPLLVAGNASARGMYVGSQVFVAGHLTVSDVIYLRFTRGGETLKVGNGVETQLLVETPHDSSFEGTLEKGIRLDQ